MNKFAHATTVVHEENDSVIHWIQTDGIKLIFIGLFAVATYTVVKKLIDSKTEK